MTNLLRRFWKWLIGLFVIGTVLAAGTQLGGELSPRADAVLSTSIDGQVKSINYTDDNAGEGLIIRTEKSDFFNFAGNVGLYFSIYNSTKDDQNVKIVFSFGRDYQQQVWEQNGEEMIAVSTFHPAIEATATTTGAVAYTSVENITKTKWTELSKANFTGTTITRKDTKGTKSLEENIAFIKSGETKFFKANVKYQAQGKEEFIIETFGDKGGYGMLDPWSYEQNFEALNIGSIDTQDSWSVLGGTVSITNADKYEGAQSVLLSGALNVAQRTMTAVNTDSIFYIAMKDTTSPDSLPTSQYSGFMIYDADVNYAFGIVFSNHKIYLKSFGSISDDHLEVYSTYDTSTWYVAEVELDMPNSRARARIHNGTTWNTVSNWLTNNSSPAMTSVSKLRLRNGNQEWNNYLDTITATNPISAPSGGGWEDIDEINI